MIYDNLIKNINNIVEVKNEIKVHFVKGAFVEINGSKEANYKVEFINNTNKEVLHTSLIKNNMWTRCNYQYFIDWLILIYEDGVLIHNELYNCEKKRVFISIESKALGDTLAWFPYIEEFRKKHNCEVIASTFLNNLFIDEYKEIQFVEPGTTVHNLYAMYCVGWFYNFEEVDYYRSPIDFKKYPMQQTSSSILGLEYQEIKPIIKQDNIEINENYHQVAIGFFGTCQAKFWNNLEGWQHIVDWFKSRNYVVKLVSKEEDGYMLNKLPKGIDKLPNGELNEVINEIKRSKLFIGIGSGLSWLSWSLNVPTVLISGFSHEYSEMQDCIRISAPKDSCSGCFNKYKLDAGDWEWCPEHKGTDRQFECSKNIKASTIIEKIETILNI